MARFVIEQVTCTKVGCDKPGYWRVANDDTQEQLPGGPYCRRHARARADKLATRLVNNAELPRE